QRMSVEKIQLRRWPGLFQQGTQIPQPPCAVMQGLLRSVLQGGDGMFASEGQQAMQHSGADGASLLHHRFGPTPGVFANQTGAIQQVIQVLSNGVPMPRMQVLWSGRKFGGLSSGVHRYLFPPLIEDTN